MEDLKKLHPYLLGINMWLIMTVCDAIDEFLLDTDCFLGVGAMIGIPILCIIIYIVNRIKNPVTVKYAVLWYIKFLAVGGSIGYFICDAVNYSRWIIKQKNRSYFMDLNGLEYFGFALFALGGFFVLSILFHIIYAIVRYIKNRRLNK